MAFDNSFLSPRGLLVNNNSDFVCHGPNFAKLKEATQATENLPYCDQMFDQRFGFSDLGHMEVSQHFPLLMPLTVGLKPWSFLRYMSTSSRLL